MKHQGDELYGHYHSLLVRRQLLHPLLCGDSVKTTLPNSTSKHKISRVQKKTRDCSPVHKSQSFCQNRPFGSTVLPKVNGTICNGTSHTKTDDQPKQERDVNSYYLQEQAQLRRMQRIEIYALNKIMRQLELNQFKNFCQGSGHI